MKKIELFFVGLIIFVVMIMSFFSNINQNEESNYINPLKINPYLIPSYNNSLSMSSVEISSQIQDKLKQESFSQFPNNFTYLSNQTNIGIIYENTSLNAWYLNNISLNTEVYFQIDLTNISIINNVNILLYFSSSDIYELIQSNYIGSSIYGSFSIENNQKPVFLVNLTNIIVTNSIEYTLQIASPDQGYDFTSAIRLNENNITSTNFFQSSQFYLQQHFFTLTLYANQRLSLRIFENTTNILSNSIVTYYRPDPDEISSQNPVPDQFFLTNEDNNMHRYSWVAPPFKGETVPIIYWIKIEIKSLVKGNFSVFLDFQENKFSYSTAVSLPINKSVVDKINLIDVYQEIRYYKFEVNSSGLEVHINITEKDPLVLNDALLEIYDMNKNSPILRAEERSSVIEGFFYVERPGTYYLVIDLSKTPLAGSYEISITFNELPPFVWKLELIILTLISLIGIPLILLIIDLRIGSKNHLWEVASTKNSLFKYISENPRLGEKQIAPDEKILLNEYPYIGTLLIEIMQPGIEEDSSVVSLRLPSKSITRLFYYIPLGLLAFLLLNYLLFFSARETLFWFFTTDIVSISVILILLLILISLPSLFFIIFRFNYTDIIKKEMEYSISTFNIQKVRNNTIQNQISIDDANKMLSYIRVLWNQAKKAFKEQNYSLFIIKADSAVKKLIELRFLQLSGNVSDKLSFEEIIENLRENAFDVPSTKKIEYFRKIRNKVVHSSHLLDEKTAIETYSYYNKFLTRLGLRT